MEVTGIDERCLHRDGPATNFVVFVYEGGDPPGRSWSVDSFLLTDALFAEVLDWLSQNLPPHASYSVGVVVEPGQPTVESDLDVAWVLGADVLNSDPGRRTPLEERIAQEMLARRDKVPGTEGSK